MKIFCKTKHAAVPARNEGCALRNPVHTAPWRTCFFIFLCLSGIFLQCGCRCIPLWEKAVNGKDSYSADQYYASYYGWSFHPTGDKRQDALHLVERKIAYSFTDEDGKLVCVDFDGVSNILYNLGYLLLGVKKILLAPLYSTGPFDWLFNLLKVLFGMLASLIMLVVGTVVGILCHPIDTFLNLTIYILTTLWDLVLIPVYAVAGIFYAPIMFVVEIIRYLLWAFFVGLLGFTAVGVWVWVTCAVGFTAVATVFK